MKKLEKPCRECPFRKGARPGWLGEASWQPEEFLTPHWRGEQHLPCHMAVNWEDPDAQAAAQQAPRCEGWLSSMRISCKQPRDPDLAKAVAEAPADRSQIMDMREFVEHHSPPDEAGTDVIRLHVTGYRMDGSIVTLFATKESGRLCPVHGDWRPMRDFLENVELPAWVDYDPTNGTLTPA